MPSNPEEPTPKKKTAKPIERAAESSAPQVPPETINSPEALERWLSDKPSEWARAIAFRAALRVFPLVTNGLLIPEGPGKLYRQKQLVLQSFRTMFLANALNKNVGDRTIVAQNAAAAASAARNAAASAAGAATDASVEAIFAAAAAAASDAPINAHKGVGHAVSAARYDGVNDHLIWQTIDAEVNWLAHRMGKYGPQAGLLREPLWMIDQREYNLQKDTLPVWILKPSTQFLRGHLVKEQLFWGLIADWYRSVLPDDPDAKPRSAFGEEADREIATKDETFWDRDPDEVMADFADIVGWQWNKDSSNKPKIVEAAGLATSGATETGVGEIAPKKDTPPQPIFIDTTRLHGDQPTSDDKLGRRVFARGMVETIDQVREDQHQWLRIERDKLKSAGRLEKLEGDGFAVHIHAPWGAGKTSVLKMMEDYMTSPSRDDTGRWIVVNFNAWRHERRNPPWWPLIDAVYRACRKNLSKTGRHWSAFNLREDWQCSNIWALAGPYVIAAAIFIALLIVSWSFGLLDPDDGLASHIPIVASAIGALGAFTLVGRWFVHGTTKNAEFHAELSTDPLQRVTRLFRKIVEQTAAPICVFIDDTDRCDGDYVVNLLEGIQTAFRHENVVYVVAADKNWIRTSFETRYKDFKRPADDVGQSLGYLFLEKIFQISTPVPGMGEKYHSDYFDMLVDNDGASGDPATQGDERNDENDANVALSNEEFDAVVDEKRERLREFAPEGVTRETADRWLRKNKSATDRAAVGLAMIQSQAAKTEFEHRLKSFKHLLPDNPRVMKRLVNAYGFRNLIGYSEDNNIDPNTLARWTILEQRFPAAADLFTQHPDWIDRIGTDAPDPDDKTMPARLKLFANSSSIREVIGHGDERLTGGDVLIITRGSRG